MDLRHGTPKRRGEPLERSGKKARPIEEEEESEEEDGSESGERRQEREEARGKGTRDK